MVMLNQTQEPEQDYGHIIIKFYAPGSAFFDMNIQAAPEQMLVVAETLRLHANAAILERREQQRIQVAVPKTNIGDLR